MYRYQEQFITLIIEREVLRFGSFTLKSGRCSPYFFNLGLLNRGADLQLAGSCYAQAIARLDIEFDTLFGPAYKGIPLVCATALALWNEQQRNVPWCFNRKEHKDHGEGGCLVGARLQGRVLLIDDVITAGTAVCDSVSLLTACGAQLGAVLIALDRQERGTSSASATAELGQKLAAGIYSIITFSDLLSYISDSPRLRRYANAMADYRHAYGA